MTPPVERHKDDPADYPGMVMRARELRRQHPQLSLSQARSMACIEIGPERNGGARLIGFDRLDRPVYERVEYGRIRRNAHSRSGDAVDVAEPIRVLETP